MAVATRSSEEIKKDAVDHLYWDSRVDASDIQVTVSDGIVTLSGTVPAYSNRQAAESDIWAVAGVKGVDNRLTIQYPPGVTVPADAELESHIENMLLWQPDIDSRDINVTVASGHVTLRGTVDAFWKKIIAEEIATSLTGVVDLTNELAVVPSRRVEDKEIAADITNALERNTNIDVNMVEVQVAGGVVTLSGSVGDLAALRAAYDCARYTPGVINVINRLAIR